MTLALPFRTVDLIARAAVRLQGAKERPFPSVEQRRAEQPMPWVLPRPPADVSKHDTIAGSVPVRIYRPAKPSGVGLLYLHGGGFMVGGIMACDHICADLAQLSGSVVVSVDYRLAPEDPFPAALDDIAEALEWFVKEAPSLGVDLDRIVVGGDSAGGNLAASLCLRVRDTPIAGQVLIYPMLDLTCSRDSWVSEATSYMHRERALGVIGRYYGDADVKHPLVSPLFAPSLAGLPPALVITAQHDTLRDDGADYAAALEADGVPVQYLDYPRMIHAFLSWPRLTKNYGAALRRVSDFLLAARAA